MSGLALQLYAAFNRTMSSASASSGRRRGGCRSAAALESGRRADGFDVGRIPSLGDGLLQRRRPAAPGGHTAAGGERRDAALGRRYWPLRSQAGRASRTIGPVFRRDPIEGEQAIRDSSTCAEGLYEIRRCWRHFRLPGWYVPAKRPSHRDHPHFRRVERLWVRELAEYDATSTLYTPDTEFADMHLMEIARGCGRGCRFCLAGYVYRPAREQPLERLLASAERAVAQGYRRVGLVSAAVSDHTQIDELATQLQAMGVAISASSMRMDPISVPLIRAMAASGAQTLTVAPEAGSQRLRNVINKTQTEEQMMEAVALAQELDFPQLKLYFMVGHPTETDDDIQALIDFTLVARSRFRRRIAINATPFVPKAHTPFQWEGMTPPAVLRTRQRTVQRALARHGVDVRADSPDWAEVQAVLSRGDQRLASVLLALPPGQVTVRSFFEAMAAHGLDKEHYCGAWQKGSPLPWDVVQSGVSERYFEYELRLAARNETGLSCPPDSAGCLSCGACDAAWAFRYGGNENRPVPSAKGGPWRAQDWQPWSRLKREMHAAESG